MRRLVVEVLRGEGFEIVEACDGGRLLVQVTSIYAHPEGDFDLIVTDIRMPICTGLQIVKGLRDARWTVPVILMTAFGDESVRASADALGAVLFDKPFLIDDLRAAALELLTQP